MFRYLAGKGKARHAVPREAPTGADDVRRWLVASLANHLSMADAGAVDTTAQFTHFGVDSLLAVRLSGELEDWMAMELEPTLLWEHPTIDSLARHLGDLLRTKAGGAA